VELDALEQTVARVVQALHREGTPGFFVGGCVRDLLLGRPLHDLDLVVAGDALGVGRRLARVLGGSFVLLDEENAIVRIVLPGDGDVPRRTVDVAALRGGDLRSDLAARDLTINAMALPLETLEAALRGKPVVEQLIDPFGGREDLERGCIRALGRQALFDDPLRTLRVVRLAAELGFAVDADTARWTAEAAPELARVSWERIRDEIARLLLCRDAGRYLPLLDRYGLLPVVLPEVEQARNTPGLEHLWELVLSLEALVAQLAGEAKEDRRLALLLEIPDRDALRRRLEMRLCDERTVLVILKLAALLHHAQPPRELSRRVGRRLRLSDREVRALVTAVERPEADRLWEGEALSLRAVYRFYRACGAIAEGVLLLALVDRLAHGKAAPDHATVRAEEVLRIACEGRERVIDPPQLLDGHTLIAALELEPGPWVGRLLEGIREAQAAGEVSTLEEALAWARAAWEQWERAGSRAE
jgi:tRNA nucleotidyltransferase/poly(A) polymerase